MSSAAQKIDLSEQFRREQTANGRRMNDAIIRGEDSPEWRDLLARPMAFMQGGKADAKVWKPTTRTLAEWLDREDQSRRQLGLTVHHADQKKDGKCFVTGGSVGGARKRDAMATLDAVGLDVDNGSDLADVLDKIEERGLAAFVYTTHSHLSDVLDPKRDLVLRKLKLDRDPTDEELRAYFREHDQHHYTDAVIDALTIEDPDCLTADGSRIIARTTPIQKFRVVLFFADTVTRQMRGKTDKERAANWTAAVKELGASFGVRVDDAATDPSRLFFAPRHKPDAEFEMYLIRGRGLRWEEIQPAANAFLQAGAEETDRKSYAAPSGADLVQWVAQHGKGFQPATLLEGTDVDTGKGSGDFLDIVCPFGDGHTDSEGGGFVKDADDGAWQWGCQHHSCKSRDRLEFIAKALEEGWFDEEDIAADSPFIVLSDEELGALEGQGTCTDTDNGSGFEPVKDWLPDWKYTVRGGLILKKGEEGEKAAPICAEFDVVGRSSNADGTAGAGIIISFRNKNGETVEKTISRSDIMTDGNAVISDLADADMLIAARGRAANDRLLDLLHDITPMRQVPVVPTPGWVRDRADRVSGFLCPTGEYIPVNEGVVRLHSDALVKDRGTMGTFEGWQTAVHTAMDVKENFYWPIGVASGFVGPIMQLMKINPVGLYFFGESGQGKSAAEVFAVTAWSTAAPKRGLFRTLNSTDNALEDIWVMGTGCVSVADEVGAMKRPQDLPAMLFGLSTGAGKDRKKGRGAGLAENAEFCTFALISSERSMRNVIEGAGGEYKNGLGRRFPTINTNDGIKVSDDTLAGMNGVEVNFGHAGPKFVRWLIAQGYHENTKALRARLDALTVKLVGKTNSNRLNKAGAVFALVALAGELAKEAGIIDRDVFPAVETAFEAFKRTDEGEGLEGGGKIVNEFRTWIQGEMGHTIVAADALTDPDARPQYRSIIGWYTDDQIILMWDKLATLPKGINGTRGALFKALTEIEAVEKSGSNNAHQSLPEDVETAGHVAGSDTAKKAGNRKVPNARLWREKLEL
ncbi:DUF927 domain-containing protein [Phaeobacter gallaeciensis]|uniref:DUF927 domain-containing protein n=1 Tax=Phaeobacter gallaeciensis TaxID=60890 RepID=UPI00237EFC23|nr:DUF927 domain-containing protein [Phaeobacter gallaeciensis]MDE4303656.1 DUF927 domain-containing protein [Phaeobacter gallaeciensis]MDE4307863.1 DUF927 domain-containing protein [Phaeobacter gallaeciensis]MDE4312321.1 DUF927 domain-containing protein [Phaeobacter gallaeciensis]MDE4316792.1 DUF927 domain-containing protein [Phaeobacter gallaeciensis]MDE4321255.1 DUF927 domain-containing protein [Phaeobacter gallaeciensis]